MQDPIESTARSRPGAATAATLPSDRDETVLRLIGKQRILSRIPQDELRALVRQATVRAVRER